MEHAVTNICNIIHYYWDHKIPAVLWAYCTTCKNLTGQTPFRLVYGQEVVMPMEYIVPSIRIVEVTEMTYMDVIEERLS